MIRFGCALCLTAISITAAPYSSLYFFGDDLSDTGNLYAGTSVLNPISIGLIPVMPTSPPYETGRFSNGPVWTETLAARLGHTNDAKPAGMSLSLFGSTSGTGHNYAIGGAYNGPNGALREYDPLIPTGILAQTDYYLSTNTPDPDALYFFFGGLNDGLKTIAVRDQFSRASISAWYLAVSMYKLYQGGARNFVVMNSPSIGFLPKSIDELTWQYGNRAAVYYNLALDYYATLLDQLPGFELTQFDVYGFSNSVLADAITGGAQYGFTSIRPCINTPSTCETSVFFDDLHPTAKFHALLGNTVADQIQTSLFNSTARPLAGRFAADDIAEIPEPATAGGVLLAIGLGVIIRRYRAFLCLLATSLSAAPFSALYFFGDALTDTGNEYAASTFVKETYYPNFPGYSIRPNPPIFTDGRWTNGSVWAETVAARLGRPNDAAPAGADLKDWGMILGTGNNYAYGESKTYRTDPFELDTWTSILGQTANYLSHRTADPDALYFFSGGEVDISDIFLISDPNTRAGKAQAAALYMVASMYHLYEGGARKFFLMNAPDLWHYEGTDHAITVLQYNFYLDYYSKLLGQLPGFELMTFDLYNFYNDVVIDTVNGGPLYGFTTRDWCTHNSSTCETSMIYHLSYPTRQLHALLGNTIADQIEGSLLTNASTRFVTSDVVDTPEPATGAVLFIAILAGAMVRRRTV